jgi:hypothetical protein
VTLSLSPGAPETLAPDTACLLGSNIEQSGTDAFEHKPKERDRTYVDCQLLQFRPPILQICGKFLDVKLVDQREGFKNLGSLDTENGAVFSHIHYQHKRVRQQARTFSNGSIRSLTSASTESIAFSVSKHSVTG